MNAAVPVRTYVRTCIYRAGVIFDTITRLVRSRWKMKDEGIGNVGFEIKHLDLHTVHRVNQPNSLKSRCLSSPPPYV